MTNSTFKPKSGFIKIISNPFGKTNLVYIIIKRTIIGCLLTLLIGCNNIESVLFETSEVSSKDFYLGVYIYDYHFAKAAKENNKDFISLFDEHLKILNAHGINAIYLAINSDKEFDNILARCKNYNIKLITQLDFAYFRDNWNEDEMNENAERAGEFIRKHVNDSQILSWSVKEEVSQDNVNSLSRYYMKILKYAPNAKFNLIHSSLGAAKTLPLPNPVISGTNRYAFWWEFSANGYCASPYFSLDWVRREAASFQIESAKREADFMLVVTQGGLMMPRMANIYGNGEFNKISYPSSLSEKKKIVSRIKYFSEHGRMGWKKFDTPEGVRYNFWKYYRLPSNCLKALAWTSVMEGARLFFCWHYAPNTKEDCDLTFEKASSMTNKTELPFITLAGRSGISNPQFEEFAEAGREINKFSRIIAIMLKKASSPAITNEKERIFNRAFNISKIPGTILVIHNGNTGIWPSNSKYFFGDEDDIRIDDEGNMMGYIPFKDPMKVSFTVPGEVVKELVCDLASGKVINAEDGKYSTDILPGSGTLIYIGTKENAQRVNILVNK